MTHRRRPQVRLILGSVLLASLSNARPAAALDQLCDSAVTNCRTQLLTLIQNETDEIDVGMWFMEDSRYSNAIIQRMQAGVKVRILMDPRANDGHPANQQIQTQLANAGVPMRKRIASGIEHWKAMIFVAQNTVYFGSANFSADAFLPVTPYVNYVDETVYYTDNASVVSSFKTKFEDAWVDTTNYANHSNAPNSSLVRRFPVTPIDPELNFPPGGSSQDFANRSVGRYNAETSKIDVIMFRITDQRHTNAIIAAANRGVPVRLIVDPTEYRNPDKFWNAWNVDRLYMAIGPARMRATVHQGINHGKLTLLYGQTMSIFGSSNWTSPSANSQHEHNYFTTNSYIFNWFIDYFERRWNNSAPTGAIETDWFVPLPPDKPVYQSPANAVTNVATTGVALTWYAGLWAHRYDILFGTDPLNLQPLEANLDLGPSQTTTQFKSYALPALVAGTTYHWKIVSKTMANIVKDGPVWSFTTAGTPPPPPPPPAGATTIVLYGSSVPPAGLHGAWTQVTDAAAANGAALQNPNLNAAKIAPAQPSPADYFETTFTAVSGVAYHLWIRMKAQGDSLSNDSVHVQFSDSTNAAGNPIARIGTTGSAEAVLQNGSSGPAVHGWGWADNGWGSLGSHIYFGAASGPQVAGSHTIRIQQREDGVVIDQIVLSPDTYLTTPPGPRRDDATILPENTGGEPPPPPPPPPPSNAIVLWTADVTVPQIHGNWLQQADATAAGGKALRNPDAGAPKIAPALSSPVTYFDVSFTAEAGTLYHVWIRMKAQGDSLANDSVHIQFSDALTPGGAPYAVIGTASSAEFVLQNGSSGPANHGWGWTDNGWGSLGPHLRFAASGTHTLRVQQREDGPTIDQIVVSPDNNLTTPPGPRKDDTTILPRTP